MAPNRPCVTLKSPKKSKGSIGATTERGLFMSLLSHVSESIFKHHTFSVMYTVAMTTD